MKPLLYISYGMPKSGSTLAFRLTEKLYEENGYAQDQLPEEILGRRRVTNFVAELNQEQIDPILAYVERTGRPLVLKTHRGPTEAAAQLVESGRAIGHAVFRDPREMALSRLDHGMKSRKNGAIAFTLANTLEECIPRIRHQIGNFNRWASLRGIVPLYYDDFAWDQGTAIKRLQTQTRLRGDAKQILGNFNDVKRMQYNKGIPHRWNTDMSPQDSEMYLEAFKDFYDRIETLRQPWRRLGNPIRRLLSQFGPG